MKIGIECEGRLKGVPTLFCDSQADESQLTIKKAAEEHGIKHIYISDLQNYLNYHFVGTLFKDYLVTLDVTDVQYENPEDIPSNVVIMLRISGNQDEIFDNVSRLRPTDMIKIEQGRNVYCFTAGSAYTTSPEEFENDIEI